MRELRIHERVLLRPGMGRLAPLAAALLLAGCSAPPGGTVAAPPRSGEPAPAAFALEGTAWKIMVEPVGGDEKPYPDVLRFEGRNLTTQVQEGRKFAPAAYSGMERDGAQGFEARLSNPDAESLVLSGRATPEAIWGTITWRRADWTLRTYRFRGAPKPN